MDTPPGELPRNRENLPRKLSKDELQKLSNLIASAGSAMLQSRAKLNMLGFLLDQCEFQEKERFPEDGPPEQSILPSATEKFLLNPAPSPLHELAEGIKYLNHLNTPIAQFDPTNFSGAELIDYLDPLKAQELDEVIDELIKNDTLNQNIGDLMLQSAPQLVQDFEEYQEVISPLTREHNIELLAGKDSGPQQRNRLEQLLKEDQDEERTCAMLEAERARILTQAILSDPENPGTPDWRAMAKEIFEPDIFELIEKQVTFTQNTIRQLSQTNQLPAATAEQLLCPEFQQRIPNPTPQQLEHLQKITEFYLLRDPGDANNSQEPTRVARTALAALYLVEHSRFLEHANVLRQYHRTRTSRHKDFAKLLDEQTHQQAQQEIEEAIASGKLRPDSRQYHLYTTFFSLKLKERKYNTILKKVGKIIDTHNRNAQPHEQIDTEATLQRLRQKTHNDLDQLFALDRKDLELPAPLDQAIIRFLDTQERKLAKKPIKTLVAGGTKWSARKLAGFVYNQIEQELIPEKKTPKGLQDAIHQAGITALDRIS